MHPNAAVLTLCILGCSWQCRRAAHVPMSSPPLPPAARAAPAGGRPRFSLVWKLALLPRRADQALCIARPEWGPPASFGSAAKVDAVLRRLAAERRAGTGPWAAQA